MTAAFSMQAVHRGENEATTAQNRIDSVERKTVNVELKNKGTIKTSSDIKTWKEFRGYKGALRNLKTFMQKKK